MEKKTLPGLPDCNSAILIYEDEKRDKKKIVATGEWGFEPVSPRSKMN